MSFRQALNKNQPVVMGVVAIVILIAGYVIYQQTASIYAGAGQPGFYSDDDGKTWFAEEVTQIPPFDHQGKQAVRCFVYQCGSETFAAYLERFTPEYKKEAAKLVNAPATMPPAERKGLEAKLHTMAVISRQVKRPGAKDWVAASDPSFKDIVVVKCKDGSSPELVRP